jgi:hypothetical protein
LELRRFEHTSKGMAKRCSGVAWAVLVGTWDKNLISELIESGQQLLVIERNAHLAERLQDDWSEQLHHSLTVSINPIGPQAGDAPWYCFNDPRLDGLLPAHAWLAEYPNIRLRFEEIRKVSTLDNLVAEWRKEHGLLESEGALLLNSQDSLSLLNGAQDLLKCLAILLCLPKNREPSADTFLDRTISTEVNTLLQSSFLTLNEDKWEEVLIWNRDYKRELQVTVSGWRNVCDRAVAERDEVAKIQAETQGRVEELNLHIDELLLERNTLTADKEKLGHAVDGLRDSVERLRQERDDLTMRNKELHNEAARERDALKNERLKLNSEKHAITADRDGLAGKVMILQDELVELRARLVLTEDERDSLAEVRDKAYAGIKEKDEELKSLILELDTMKSKTLMLVATNEKLLCANASLTAEKATHQSVLHTMMVERDALTADIARIRERQAFLLELTEQSETRLAPISDLLMKTETNPSGPS